MVIIMYAVVLIGTKLLGGVNISFSCFAGETAIGFVVWMVCSEIVDQFPSHIINYSKSGVLEQIFLSSIKGEYLIVINLMMSTLWHIVKAVVIFIVIVLFTKTPIFFDIMIIPISILTIMSVMGIGFILIGFGLIYKIITSFNSLISYIFLGFALSPIKEIQHSYIRNILPFVSGINDLKQIMLTKTNIGSIDFLILVVNSLSYFLLGFSIMCLCIKYSKKKGILGQY